MTVKIFNDAGIVYTVFRTCFKDFPWKALSKPIPPTSRQATLESKRNLFYRKWNIESMRKIDKFSLLNATLPFPQYNSFNGVNRQTKILINWKSLISNLIFDHSRSWNYISPRRSRITGRSFSRSENIPANKFGGTLGAYCAIWKVTGDAITSARHNRT